MKKPRNNNEQLPNSDDDPRFTHGFIYDVVQVLEKHGYSTKVSNKTMGRIVLSLFKLTRVVQGGEP